MIALDALDIQGTPRIGAPTGEYDLRAEAKAKAYSLDAGEIERALRRDLAGYLGTAGASDAYAIEDVKVAVETFDPAAGTASLRLTATAHHR